MAGLDAFSDESLEARSLEELRQIAWQRRALIQQLETEVEELQEQHNVGRRIQALEGAVELAQFGAFIDEDERARLLNNLLADIREDHHHVAPLTDYGSQASRLTHGVVFDCPEHPIRAQSDQISSQTQVPQSRRVIPKDQAPHPYVGREGAFADSYKRADYGFTEKGWDFSHQVANARPNAAYLMAQPVLDEMCEAEDQAMQKVQQYKAYQAAERAVSPLVPPCFWPAGGYVPTGVFQEAEPLPYDHGHIWVNKAREDVLTRSVQWQMAHAGIPVEGAAPPVNSAWLRNTLGTPAANQHQHPIPHPLTARAAIKKAEAEGVAVDRLGAYKRGNLDVKKEQNSWFSSLVDQLP